MEVERRAVLVARKSLDGRYAELYRTRYRYYVMFRDKATGRFVKRPDIARLSTVMHGIVIHSTYHNAIIQLWVTVDEMYARDTEIEDWAEDKLKEFVEECVGYPENEWWFTGGDLYVIRSGWSIIPWTPSRARELFELLFTWRTSYEDESGAEIESWYGDVPEEMGT